MRTSKTAIIGAAALGALSLASLPSCGRAEPAYRDLAAENLREHPEAFVGEMVKLSGNPSLIRSWKHEVQVGGCMLLPSGDGFMYVPVSSTEIEHQFLYRLTAPEVRSRKEAVELGGSMTMPIGDGFMYLPIRTRIEHNFLYRLTAPEGGSAYVHTKRALTATTIAVRGTWQRAEANSAFANDGIEYYLELHDAIERTTTESRR